MLSEPAATVMAAGSALGAAVFLSAAFLSAANAAPGSRRSARARACRAATGGFTMRILLDVSTGERRAMVPCPPAATQRPGQASTESVPGRPPAQRGPGRTAHPFDSIVAPG